MPSFFLNFVLKNGLMCLIFTLPYYVIINYSECLKIYIVSKVALNDTVQEQFTEYSRACGFLWNFMLNLWNVYEEAESHMNDIHAFIWLEPFCED